MTKITKIIVALDGMKHGEALKLAEKLSGRDILFKVNDLLDDREGPSVIETLRHHGSVMVDSKLHDIPNTVKNRIIKYAKYKPEFITVHASGGIEMMRMAAMNSSESAILAVTVLTSLGGEECNINLGGSVKAKVLQYAHNAVLAGVHGIVCSPNELEFLSKFPELKSLIKVTPGIRPKWHFDPKDDQSRVTTPADAARMGADYLVIGRPIVEADNPVEAVKKIQEEISNAIMMA